MRLPFGKMISSKNLLKSFDNGEERLYALNDVSFDIDDGEFVVVLGPSGSGKTTLLNCISGLDSTDSGTICYGDADISKMSQKELTQFRRENTAFIFQSYYLLQSLTVESNVRLGAELSKNTDYLEMLEAVGLKGKEKSMPYELSGGEQQRVSIARALAKRPKYLFCDEPTGALDEGTGRQVLEYIIDCSRKYNITLVMVTHNSNFQYLADKVIEMNSGRIVNIRSNDSPCAVKDIRW